MLRIYILQNTHPEHWKKHEEAKMKRSGPSSSTFDCGMKKIPGPSTLQMKLTGRLSSATVSQETVNKLIVDYITEEMKPLRTVEADSFCRLITGLCPTAKVPTRATLKEKIDASYTTMFNAITSNLLSIPFVCTTADLWSSQNRSFLGMTVHWIDPNTYLRKSAALASKRFKDGHTNDKIAAAISQVHCQYGISGKVVRTCTDNAANMLKAFADHQAVTGSSATNELSETEDEEESNDNAADLTEMLHQFDDSQNGNNIDNNDGTTAVVLPPHMRCCSHSLNLVATTDASKALVDDKKYKRVHNLAMAKCSGLWNLTSRSTKAADTAYDILGYRFSIPTVV